MAKQANPKKTVIFKGAEYDISKFVKQHPGGAKIIDRFTSIQRDITQYFVANHSQQAQRKLMNMKILSKVDRPKMQKVYCKIQERVRRHYRPSYVYEILLLLMTVGLFSVAALSQVTYPITIILCFAAGQILTAWIGHSQLHLRNTWLNSCPQYYGALFNGLSASWWSQKHAQHHFFTNSDKFDGDIRESYPLIFYPLLLIKWRIQSIKYSLQNLKFKQFFLIVLHYYIFSKQRFLPLLTGTLIAGYFISLVADANHNRQKRYKGSMKDDFITHQVDTTTNYDYYGHLNTLILGGFNYHTEHHLFPQVPFYNLQIVHKIAVQQLNIYKKTIKTSMII